MDILNTYSNPAFQFENGQQMFSGANQGNVFYVRPRLGSAGQDGKSPQTAFSTLQEALTAATANQNDIIYLMAEGNSASNTTARLSAAMDWNKDGVHLIGVNAGPMIGQRSRIAELSTVKTIEDMFTVSANGCYIANIEFFQGVATSTATAARAVVISGQRNVIENCQISGNGDLGGSTDDAGARSLAVTGSENLIKHCYIGLDTVIRATQTAEVFVGTGARNIFEDCVVNSYTSLSTFKAVQATSYDRFVIFKNCMFIAIQNITSAVAPTGAIGNTTPNGQLMMQGGGVYGYANVTTADDTKMYVSAPAGGLVDMGLATTTDIAP